MTKILISGASGLIGSELQRQLKLSDSSPEIYRLVRRRPLKSDKEIFWDPYNSEVSSELLEGFNTVIHLAGDNIASQRWNAAKKQLIKNSRIIPTRFLSESLARLKSPPAVFISASALGYYGDRPHEKLTEDSPPGSGFLAETCVEWEAAAKPAESAGIRLINGRIGVVVTKRGGMLERMLLPFRLGLGGKLGDGQQMMSWIALEDLCRAIIFCMEHQDISGAVNLVAPTAVSNAEFTKTLAKCLKRPAFFSVPKFAAKLAFGEMAEALMFSSTEILPAKLLGHNFKFLTSDLSSALEQELGC